MVIMMRNIQGAAESGDANEAKNRCERLDNENNLKNVQNQLNQVLKKLNYYESKKVLPPDEKKELEKLKNEKKKFEAQIEQLQRKGERLNESGSIGSGGPKEPSREVGRAEQKTPARYDAFIRTGEQQESLQTGIYSAKLDVSKSRRLIDRAEEKPQNANETDEFRRCRSNASAERL